MEQGAVGSEDRRRHTLQLWGVSGCRSGTGFVVFRECSGKNSARRHRTGAVIAWLCDSCYVSTLLGRLAGLH